MNTTVRNNPEESRNELSVDERLTGSTQYRLNGERIAMDHTEVVPEYERQGLGDQLAQAAMDGEID